MKRLLLWVLGWILWLFRDEAVRLNFAVECDLCGPPGDCWKWSDGKGQDMAKIGDTFTGRIAPTNAAGAPVPVFSQAYFEDGDSYDVSIAPDGMSAVFTANSAGTGNVARVIATTKGGATLEESVALPDVESPADEEAVALNLTVA